MNPNRTRLFKHKQTQKTLVISMTMNLNCGSPPVRHEVVSIQKPGACRLDVRCNCAKRSARGENKNFRIANGMPYGLEAYLFSRVTERALRIGREIHAGGVKVNGSTMLSLNLFAPRPAWGWSGIAEEGTIETFRFFCGTSVVGVEAA